ncbi:MAG: DUF1223 domain-containing protein [Pseudomonadota bacterium]
MFRADFGFRAAFGIAMLVMGAVFLASLGAPRQTAAQSLSADANAPALIELFTSQGCSSCPPADRLAARLDADPSLVVISRPVDYWDRLGWKDTFASPANTALQQAYRRRELAGYNGVYTPQAVINGRAGEVGSDEPALRRLLASAPPATAGLSVRAVPGKGFAIGLAGKTQRTAELVAVSVKRRASVNIGRGENRGRRVTYTNVLLGERRIAQWTGGDQSIALNRTDLPGGTSADRHALILHVPEGGPVLAARWLD